jgi:hypothetical protein
VAASCLRARLSARWQAFYVPRFPRDGVVELRSALVCVAPRRRCSRREPDVRKPDSETRLASDGCPDWCACIGNTPGMNDAAKR